MTFWVETDISFRPQLNEQQQLEQYKKWRYAIKLCRNRHRSKRKRHAMKKLIAPIAALVIALTPGCMTSKAVVKSINNSMAPIIDALAKDTNSCYLRIVATVFTLEFSRNVGNLNAPPSSTSFSVTPTTTLQVRPTP